METLRHGGKDTVPSVRPSTPLSVSRVQAGFGSFKEMQRHTEITARLMQPGWMLLHFRKVPVMAAGRWAKEARRTLPLLWYHRRLGSIFPCVLCGANKRWPLARCSFCSVLLLLLHHIWYRQSDIADARQKRAIVTSSDKRHQSELRKAVNYLMYRLMRVTLMMMKLI